jgi:hypothetical protein
VAEAHVPFERPVLVVIDVLGEGGNGAALVSEIRRRLGLMCIPARSTPRSSSWSGNGSRARRPNRSPGIAAGHDDASTRTPGIGAVRFDARR